MKIGLIGLPLTGKTTLFNLLTQTKASTGLYAAKAEANLGTARVPDRRIDFLSELYKPRKTIYADRICRYSWFDRQSEGQSRVQPNFNDVRPCEIQSM